MNKLLIFITALCLVTLPLQAEAAKKSKVESHKDRLVLMPLRLTEDIEFMQGAMETSLVEGLQEKYLVFAGEDVAKKTREIFKKASDKQKCDETRCLQDIAIAFQSELVAVANVNKIEGGYLLALSIKDVMTNEAIYSKTIPCEGCNPFRVVDRLKELGGGGVIEARIAPAAVAEVSPAAIAPSKSIEPPIDNSTNGNYVTQGGLTWMPISFIKTWPDANVFCSQSLIKNQSGWRLPSKDELIALYTSGEMNNKGWTLSNSWSSKSNGNDNHYIVSLSNGDIYSDADSFHNLVTCVRETSASPTNSANPTNVNPIIPIKPPALHNDNFVTQGSMIWIPIETHQNWFLANTYCTNATINGKAGWRLPTKEELSVLYESGIAKNQVWGNLSPWSSTSNGTGYHYVLDLINGRSSHSENDNVSNFVMCVHESSKVPSGYVSEGGLNWMPINNSIMHWSEAKDYCLSKDSKYMSGWRLPSKEELSALYASGLMKNHGWTLGYTWSNSKAGDKEHFLTDLKSGQSLSNQDNFNNQVTCVRSNK